MFKLILGTPPFITGLRSMVSDLSGWLLLLVPTVLILIVILTGFSMYQKNDPHEANEAKQKGIRAAIITGVIASATWIGNYVWTTFGGTAPAVLGEYEIIDVTSMVMTIFMGML